MFDVCVCFNSVCILLEALDVTEQRLLVGTGSFERPIDSKSIQCINVSDVCVAEILYI